MDGHQRTFFYVSAYCEAFLRISALYIIAIIHIIFILSVQYICITSWDSPVALMSIGLVEFHVVHKRSLGKFHRESTLRFIPNGCEIPRVLIHLLSRISQRQGSWLYS